MTVAEMIAQRTVALRTILHDSGQAIHYKGGTPADDLSGLQDAILSIPSGGGVLPVLTNPAAAGDVIAGKEYIDGNGDKKAGTLVVCDTITEVESLGIAGTGVSVDIESSADGSASMLTLPEPNLKTENIKSGISIFGIQGSLVGGGAKEPYIEETYDANGNLIDVNLVGYTAIRTGAFYACTKLALTSLPSGITSIGDSAFNSCANLALTSLPSGITRIGNYAFNSCTNLALTSLPSGITAIGAYAFGNCTELTSITFQGKPGSIHSTAFNGCTNLKTINVPWASGEVANAPWGATNATINYNYTG